jgi:hypothetical protein
MRRLSGFVKGGLDVQPNILKISWRIYERVTCTEKAPRVPRAYPAFILSCLTLGKANHNRVTGFRVIV